MSSADLRERIAEALFNRQEWGETQNAKQDPGSYPGGRYEPRWWGDLPHIDRDEFLADADALLEAVPELRHG